MSGAKRDGPRSSEPADIGRLHGGSHGLSAEQVAESQRERLLAAAVTLVAEHGYEKTTLTDIAKTASVANRVFYANFADKEDCIATAMEAMLSHLGNVVARAGEQQGEWPERVIAGLSAALTFLDSEPEVARICILVPFSSTQAITERFSARVSEAGALLSAGRQEREENVSLPASTEESVIGGVITMLYGPVEAAAELSPLLPDLVEFVLTPYLGPEAAAKRSVRVRKAAD